MGRDLDRTEAARIFGQNLTRLRRLANLSQEELGFLADVHRTQITTIEGGRLPRIETLIRLAGALSLPPGDLLWGMAWIPSVDGPGRFLVSRAEPRAVLARYAAFAETLGTPVGSDADRTIRNE